MKTVSEMLYIRVLVVVILVFSGVIADPIQDIEIDVAAGIIELDPAGFFVNAQLDDNMWVKVWENMETISDPVSNSTSFIHSLISYMASGFDILGPTDSTEEGCRYDSDCVVEGEFCEAASSLLLGSGQCTACSETGAYCTTDAQCCGSELCIWGRCEIDVESGDPGSFCETTGDCNTEDLCCVTDNFLSKGLCQPLPALGMPCRMDQWNQFQMIIGSLSSSEVQSQSDTCQPCAPGLECQKRGTWLNYMLLCVPSSWTESGEQSANPASGNVEATMIESQILSRAKRRGDTSLELDIISPDIDIDIGIEGQRPPYDPTQSISNWGNQNRDDEDEDDDSTIWVFQNGN